MRTDFRPGIWPSLVSLFALATLIGLGIWQLQRLSWKTELIAALERRSSEPVRPLPERIDDPAALEWQRVRTKGRFDHARELHLVSGRGYVLVTPLLRENAASVLVLRGFVPEDLLPQESRTAGLVAGETVVEGIIRLDAQANPFLPDNEPARNLWYSRDHAAMAAAAGLGETLPLFLAATDDAPGGWPRAEMIVGANIPNNHLAYAITWFGLAAALLAIYVLHGLRRGRNHP